MLSRTTSVAPASTSSPTATGMATTTAGDDGADQAGFVLADAMTYAVHLDEEPGGARGRDDREAVVAKDESTLEFAEPFDLDDEFAAVSNDSVAARTDLSDGERCRPGPGS